MNEAQTERQYYARRTDPQRPILPWFPCFRMGFEHIGNSHSELGVPAVTGAGSVENVHTFFHERGQPPRGIQQDQAAEKANNVSCQIQLSRKLLSNDVPRFPS